MIVLMSYQQSSDISWFISYKTQLNFKGNTLIIQRQNESGTPNYSNPRAYRKTRQKQVSVLKYVSDSIQVYSNICHLIIKDSIQDLS